MSRSTCLTDSDLTALADEGDSTRRSELELHLSRCAACRHRLVEAHRLSQPMEVVAADGSLKGRVRGLPPTSQRRTARSWLAAAAVVLVAGAGTLWWLKESAVDSAIGVSGSTDANTVWRADAAISPKLEILAPAPAGEIRNLELSWRPIDRVGPYTLTFLDELGNVVWQVDSDQETWRPDQHPLAAGRQYFWYVSAPLGQRDRVESEISSFVLAP